jgi:hypothetical protein
MPNTSDPARPFTREQALGLARLLGEYEPNLCRQLADMHRRNVDPEIGLKVICRYMGIQLPGMAYLSGPDSSEMTDD